MPFDVRMPDGVIIQNIPDGTPKDVIHQKWVGMQSAGYGPTEGMSTLDKAWAGAGKAVYDLGRGAGQALGAVSRKDVAESRALDAPLMATTGGKVGNLAGNIAAMVPASFVPGANTITGAGIIGAASGLLQPSESTRETLSNVALGAGAGVGGQALGQVGAPKNGQAITNRAAAAAEAKSLNSVRDSALAEARKVGYKIPPAAVNQTSTTARAIESIAGKESMKQTAAVHNQQITNKLVRQEFGLPNGAPLSKKTLDSVRQQAGSAYQAVRGSGDVVTDQQYLNELTNLSHSADELRADFPDMDIAGSEAISKLQNGLLRDKFSANGALEMMKELRHSASQNLAWNVDDPAKKALGLAQREAAGIVEEQVIRHLKAKGKDALASAFDKSRQTIAKTYSVQAALNEGSGNVVAPKLAAQLRKGKPLSGNLEKIARLASSVDSGIVKEQVGSPGVSALVGTLAMGGGAGSIAAGSPEMALVAAGLPFTREMTRRLLLSGPAQRLAAPSYSPNNGLLEIMKRLTPLAAPVGVGVANSEQ